MREAEGGQGIDGAMCKVQVTAENRQRSHPVNVNPPMYHPYGLLAGVKGYTLQLIPLNLAKVGDIFSYTMNKK